MLQATFNMLVAVGIMPVTGQPLPLISKGGTSTLVNCVYIGMILSISRYVNDLKRQQAEELLAQQTEQSQEIAPEIISYHRRNPFKSLFLPLQVNHIRIWKKITHHSKWRWHGRTYFPAVSIANAIKELYPDTEILFIGAEGRMEMQRVPAAGYKIIGLPVAGFDRKHLLKTSAYLSSCSKVS